MPATTVLPSAGASHTHDQKTPTALTPPPTQNLLDATDRLRLVKSNRKLGKLLGATPHILEMPSRSSQEDELTALPFTPTESTSTSTSMHHSGLSVFDNNNKPHHRLFSHKPRSASLASSVSSQIALLNDARTSGGIRRRESLILPISIPKTSTTEAGLGSGSASPVVMGRSGVVIAECGMADMDEVVVMAAKKKGVLGMPLPLPLSMPRPGTGGKGSSSHSQPPMLRLTAITANFGGGSRKGSGSSPGDVDLNLKGLTVQTSLNHHASSMQFKPAPVGAPSLPEITAFETISSDTSPVSPLTPSTPLTPTGSTNADVNININVGVGVGVGVGDPPLTPNTPHSDTDEMDEMDMEAHQVMMRRKRMDKLERHLGERVPRELVFPKMKMKMKVSLDSEFELGKRSLESTKDKDWMSGMKEGKEGKESGFGLSRWRSRSKSRSRGTDSTPTPIPTPRKSGETRGRSFSRPRSSNSKGGSAISVTRSSSVDVHYPLNPHPHLHPGQGPDRGDAPGSSSTFRDAQSFMDMDLATETCTTKPTSTTVHVPLPSPVTDTDAPFQSHLEAISIPTSASTPTPTAISISGSNSNSNSNYYPPILPSPNALSLLTDASDFSQARRSRSLKRSRSARGVGSGSVGGGGGVGGGSGSGSGIGQSHSHSLERGARAGASTSTSTSTGTPRRSAESSSGSHSHSHSQTSHRIQEDDEFFGTTVSTRAGDDITSTRTRRSGDGDTSSSRSTGEDPRALLTQTHTHGPVVRSERKQGWSGQWNRSDMKDVMGGLRALR